MTLDKLEGKDVSLEELIFESNLREFSTKAGFVCGLEHNGKMSGHEAYEKIETLFHELERSKDRLLGHDGDDG